MHTSSPIGRKRKEWRDENLRADARKMTDSHEDGTEDEKHSIDKLDKSHNQFIPSDRPGACSASTMDKARGDVS